MGYGHRTKRSGANWTARGRSRRVELLYRRHVRRITTYVATRSSRADDVADLVAATFVAAFESRATYDPARGEVVAWLIGIARHLSVDQLRQALREHDALVQVAGDRVLARDEIAELEARIDAVREAAELSGLLARLHARDREPLLLVGVVGLDYAQAAQALGISRATFRVRLLRARRALARARTRADGSQDRTREAAEATT
jgi:RNA polymerase sigma factor (sigma-70 family)